MKGLETTASMRQMTTSKSESSPPNPWFFWQAGGRRCRGDMKVVERLFLKHLLEWKEWLGKLALGFIFGMFAEGGGHTSQFFPSLSTAFLEQNRDRPACASWSLPWGNPKRGRWEAAERQLEPWWAVCHRPLFPLWSGFLLLYSQKSLQVPGNMYTLENIYNLLTSWELILFSPRSWKW